MKINKVCRRCRREGQKLFLKGEKCLGAKCPFTRRSYPPGEHGQSRGMRPTEFARQLREKQKASAIYGVTEKVLRNVYKKANKKRSSIILELEKRLDNAVFRLGFAPSRRAAKKLIKDGHILVNNKKITVASYQVKLNNSICLSKKIMDGQLGKDLTKSLKKFSPPSWLVLDKKNMTGKVEKWPEKDEVESSLLESLIIEYYSK